MVVVGDERSSCVGTTQYEVRFSGWYRYLFAVSAGLELNNNWPFRLARRRINRRLHRKKLPAAIGRYYEWARLLRSRRAHAQPQAEQH